MQRKTKRALYIIAPLLIIGAIFVFTKMGVTGKAIQQPTENEAQYEITETDIFSLPSFHAEQVSVMGVALGDIYDTVIEKLGIPDKQYTPKENILNLEYGKKFKLAGTGLIIQLRDDEVKKITVREPFNPFLQGKTRITHSKEDIYINVLGKPDETLFVPETPNSARAIRLIQYKDKGIEVIIKQGEQIGFTLTRVFDNGG